MFTKAVIEDYFTRQKKGGILLMFAGIAGIIASCVFFFIVKTAFWRGAAFPLFGAGLILTMAGFAAYRRSDTDRIRNVYAYDMNPAELKEKELPRMKKKMRSYKQCRYAALLLLLAGVFLYVYFIRDFNNDFWRGFGLALTQAAVLILFAGFIAEQRGRRYAEELASFTAKW